MALTEESFASAESDGEQQHKKAAWQGLGLEQRGELSSGSAAEPAPGGSWVWQQQEEEYSEKQKEKTRKSCMCLEAVG